MNSQLQSPLFSIGSARSRFSCVNCSFTGNGKNITCDDTMSTYRAVCASITRPVPNAQPRTIASRTSSGVGGRGFARARSRWPGRSMIALSSVEKSARIRSSSIFCFRFAAASASAG